jgi:Homeodomain
LQNCCFVEDQCCRDAAGDSTIPTQEECQYFTSSTSSAVGPMTSADVSMIIQAVYTSHHRLQQQQQHQPPPTTSSTEYTSPSFSAPQLIRASVDPAAAAAAAAPMDLASHDGLTIRPRRRRTMRKPHGRQAIRILEEWYKAHQPYAYADRKSVASLAVATKLTEEQVRKWLANNRRKNNETGCYNNTRMLHRTFAAENRRTV